jgi:Mycoplasma protein of unknown function, DUF285
MAHSKFLWLLLFAFAPLSCLAKHPEKDEPKFEASNVVDDATIHEAVQLLWNGSARDRAEVLKRYGPMEHWDTSRVTSLAGLFRGLDRFRGEGLSNWDTSKVTSMSDTFSGCSDLNPTESLAWNSSFVTTMSRMFLSTTSFDGNLALLDTSRVTDMSHMFHVSLLPLEPNYLFISRHELALWGSVVSIDRSLPTESYQISGRRSAYLGYLEPTIHERCL